MSEKDEKVGNAIPSSRLELGIRMGQLLALFPSRAEAGKVAGKSVDQLKLYEKGQTAAPFEVLARLAADRGVSLDWLASGTGAMYGGSAASGGLDRLLLQNCAQAIEEVLAERRLDLPPAKKARILVVFYEYSLRTGQVDRKTAGDMIEVAA